MAVTVGMRWQSLIANLRQLRYRREFRIEDVEWPAGISDAIEALARPPLPPRDPPETAAARKRLLSDVATGLWRLRQRMTDPASGRPLEPMRRAFRHFESIWDALVQGGLEVVDHTGQPVPDGGVYGLKTVAYQPTPGLDREKVIETIKPSVYYANDMIQMGEVIVGTPLRPDTQTSGESR